MVFFGNDQGFFAVLGGYNFVALGAEPCLIDFAQIVIVFDKE